MSACAGLVRPPSVLIVNTVTNAIRRRPFPAASSYLSPCSDTAHRKKNAQTDLDCTSSLAAPTHRTNRMLLPRFLPRRRQPPTAALHPPAPQIPSLTLTRTRAKITPSPSSSSSLLCRCNGIERLWPRMLSTAPLLRHVPRIITHTHTKKHTHHHTHTQKLNSAFAQRSSSEGGWMDGDRQASSHH